MKKWAVLACLIAITPAGAGEAPVLALSIGAESCGKFVAAGTQAREQYLAFTLGFITGANFGNFKGTSAAGQSWDRDSAMIWLENYCRANPLEVYVMAALGYRDALIAKQK